MMRYGMGVVVAGLVAAAGAPAWAEPVPAALQGRWGEPSDCAVAGAGLTIGPDSLTMGGGGRAVTLTVDASEVHDGQARMTIKAIVGAPPGGGGPKAGDSLVLQRTGDTLRPLESVASGTKRDLSGEKPVGLCK